MLKPQTTLLGSIFRHPLQLLLSFPLVGNCLGMPVPAEPARRQLGFVWLSLSLGECEGTAGVALPGAAERVVYEAEGIFRGSLCCLKQFFQCKEPFSSKGAGLPPSLSWERAFCQVPGPTAPRARYVSCWKLNAKHHPHLSIVQSSVCIGRLALRQGACLPGCLPRRASAAGRCGCRVFHMQPARPP